MGCHGSCGPTRQYEPGKGSDLQEKRGAHSRLMSFGWICALRLRPQRYDGAAGGLQHEGATDVEQIEGRIGASRYLLWVVFTKDREAQHRRSTGRRNHDPRDKEGTGHCPTSANCAIIDATSVVTSSDSALMPMRRSRSASMPSSSAEAQTTMAIALRC